MENRKFLECRKRYLEVLKAQKIQTTFHLQKVIGEFETQMIRLGPGSWQNTCRHEAPRYS